MALRLKVPPPLERQVTETKWDAAAETLRVNPDQETSTACLTPTHTYTVVRDADGTLSRVRTKSQEDTNVDLAPSPRSGGSVPVVVGDASEVAAALVRGLREEDSRVPPRVT
jgi:hypothetical protein